MAWESRPVGRDMDLRVDRSTPVPHRPSVYRLGAGAAQHPLRARCNPITQAADTRLQKPRQPPVMQNPVLTSAEFVVASASHVSISDQGMHRRATWLASMRAAFCLRALPSCPATTPAAPLPLPLLPPLRKPSFRHHVTAAVLQPTPGPSLCMQAGRQAGRQPLRMSWAS